jgi:D-beta-D-heptose 7-phosphate kinase/D-beta-D-heptose 1-phosphate adenosyltransferase
MGALTLRVIGEIRKQASIHKLPILGDIKPKNAPMFHKVQMLSPNEREARAYLGRPDGNEPLDEIARELSGKFSTTVFLTAGEQGMYVSSHGGEAQLVSQRHRVEVRDVSGCGDTAAAVIMLATLCGATYVEAAELANAAAAVVAGHIGAVAPTPEEVLAMLMS